MYYRPPPTCCRRFQSALFVQRKSIKKQYAVVQKPSKLWRESSNRSIIRLTCRTFVEASYKAELSQAARPRPVAAGRAGSVAVGSRSAVKRVPKPKTGSHRYSGTFHIEALSSTE
jgi:hypothetical protein